MPVLSTTPESRTRSARVQERPAPALEQVGERGGRVAPAWDLVVLVAGSLLLAAPFLVLHHVNTVDGPGHVLGGEVVGNLRDSAVVSHYYNITFSWVPNMLMQYLLAALSTFLSPTWSEKVFVTGYVVGLPLAFRYAIRSVDRTAGWLALGSLPLVVNRPLLTGFYSFSYGMIGAVLAVGIAIRARGRWSPSRAAGLAITLVLTYAAHPIPLVIALVIIASITVCDMVSDLRSKSGWTFKEAALDRALWPTLAVLPAAVMLVAFVLSGDAGGTYARFLPVGSLLGGLVTLTLPLVSYSNYEAIGSVIAVLVLGTLTLLTLRADARRKKSTLTTGLVTAAVMCLLVYLVTPDDLGIDASLSPRLALFVPLAVLLVCGSLRAGARFWRPAGLLFLASALALAGARLPSQVHYDGLVDEFLTVERVIPPGSTLLVVRYASFGRLDPLVHETSRVAADRDDVSLVNVEVPGPDYQEVLRPRFEKLLHFLRGGSLNLAGYEDAGGRIDYVLVVGRDHPTAGVSRPGPGFEQQLNSQFVRVMVTRAGLVQVYRHR